ncbi:glycerol-3-phosphate responsive antiterminator [uncultured Ilyobacter sp.]|uniref:glycerol-3-phosphate responsive antiterminator n=1 Tax=uncultured Ilyobacter sp. TaxID=544433 RepID=UPI0029F4BD78|nr:glycerol-3-phosphate responsive antiterminator [uncultured Ilyobacter sp.]
MNENITNLFSDNIVIPSIKDANGLEKALRTEHKVVFVLYGDLLNIGEIIKKLKDKGKIVFVNLDLLVGFSSKEIIIPYLKKYTELDGILSSKASLVKESKKHGLISIHRFFLIDSFSYQNMYKQLKISKPDILEILPGWDKVVSWTKKKVDIPIISGGLVCKDDMVRQSIKAGAVAVSTTNIKLWNL